MVASISFMALIEILSLPVELVAIALRMISKVSGIVIGLKTHLLGFAFISEARKFMTEKLGGVKFFLSFKILSIKIDSLY